MNDFSWLSPEQAKQRLFILQARLHAEQFAKNWFIRSTDNYQYLKNEIHALFEGRISEFHGWTDIVGQIIQPIVDAVNGAFSWLWQNVMQPAIDAMLVPVKWVLDGINTVVGWIQQGVNAVFSTVKGIWDTLSKAWSNIVETVSGAFEAVTKALTGLGEWIVNGLKTAVSFIYDVLKGFWDSVIVPIGNAVRDALNWIAQQIMNMMNSAINSLMNILTGIGEMTPDRFSNVGLTLLTTTGLAAGGLLGMTAVWDIIHPFKDIIPGELKAMIYDVTSFKLILGGLAGAAVAAAISTPGRYFFNSVLCPNLPSDRDALDMFRRGIMSQAEYERILQYHGYGKTYRQKYLASVWKVPSINDANEWMHRKLIDEKAYQWILQSNGVNPEHVQYYHAASYDVPQPRDAIQWLQRNLASETETKQLLAMARIPEQYVDRYIQAAWRMPDIDQAMRMYWRGLIDAASWDYILAAQGLHPAYRKAMTGLLETLPNPSDLVRFVVREVALMPRDYDTPEFFIDAMKKWGYSDYWARAYWWSHWELPEFGRLQQAYYRKLITHDEFLRYVQWHDYSPEARPGISKSDVEIMSELIWQLPGKLDARFMRRWGLIDQKEHEYLLRADGMHPDWLSRVALAERMNMLQDERGEVKSVLRSMLSAGMLVPDVYVAKLREQLFTAEEAQLSAVAASLRWDYELFKAAVDAAVFSYRFGKITLEELSQQLSDLGMPAEKVQARVNLEAARAIEARRETIGESVYIYGRDIVMSRFKAGIIDAAEFEAEMKLIGYTDRQIGHLKEIAILQRDYDYATAIISAIQSALEKNKISDERAIQLLQSYGVQPERIQQLMTVVRIKKGIGVAE